MTRENYTREMIREVLTITDKDLPEFVWLTRERYELVFSNNIRKRVKEFFELKKLVLHKILVIQKAPAARAESKSTGSENKQDIHDRVGTSPPIVGKS